MWWFGNHYFMRIYWVYILRCSDGSYYTGITNDIRRRVLEHDQGLISGCYTHTRRPVQLVHADCSDKINEIIHREKQIKGWTRKKKKALIRQQEWLLPLLSERQTPQLPGYKPRKGFGPLSR